MEGKLARHRADGGDLSAVRVHQPTEHAPSDSMTSIVHFGSATSEQLPALYFLPGSTRLRACVDSRRDGAVCCDTENGLGVV